MLAAIVWLAIVVVAAVGAPWLAPADPIDQDLGSAFATFGSDHLLGADHLGRDVLSRLMSGARIAGIAVLITTAVALTIGVPGGLVLGYRGGRFDR
jgi:ABC-type dipeptide/oligopeptide/nickel transport system permease subunit